MKEKYIKKDKEYFVETKSGSISVNDIHKEILTIMDEIHRVCEKNDIKYCLIAGSALGMCNYGGFIPWDDDIDMAILRKDWLKFIEALKKDLSDEFYFQCFETDKKYNTIINPSMKIRKKGTYIEEVNTLLKNRCKSGDGIFVDVVIYDNICENKVIDQLGRTVTRVIMPFIVLLDNLHLNPVLLKKFNVWHANKYSRRYENSKLMSQPISVPWEKIGKEPIFLKEDILPFKKYDFEGRKFYSYNNIEKVMHEWYGPNCLKRWNGKYFEEPLPVEKRKPKHIKDINLHDDKPIKHNK